MNVKVLMFGWEFPPFQVGGLGRVTYELSHALADTGAKITLILPVDVKNEKVRILPTNISIKEIETVLRPYMTEKMYKRFVKGERIGKRGRTFMEEVEEFTKRAVEIAKGEKFDVIHCHDWMTFMAGVEMKRISKKPLVVHVHATEIDRSGGNPNPHVYEIEKKGFEESDVIIAVSEYTKRVVVENYGIDEKKIAVVHNAIEFDRKMRKEVRKGGKKIVLYLGRLTLQKGPDYFIRAAKKVLEHEDAIFIVAGKGEMMPRLIDLACKLGIEDRVFFTGYLSDEEVERVYKMASVYVMPSVSEPFGLTALEAAFHGTPIIISKSSGAREVLKNCLSVDFWDIEEMANKIVSVLRYAPLREEITERAFDDLKAISWKNQAKKVLNIYLRVIKR